jgi:hypothetical protein
MGQSPWRSGGLGELPGTPWVKFDTVTTGGWIINTRGDAMAGSIAIPFDTPLIIDWRRLCVGPMCWKPYDTKLMVPVGHEMRDPPEGYVDAMAVPVLFEDYGLSKLTSSSAYVNNALYAAHMAYTFAGEAQAGKLSVYVSEKSDPIFNAKFNQNYYAPKLRLIGWIERDPETFGPALVPPPTPLLSGGTGSAAPWPAVTPVAPAIAATPVQESPPVQPPPAQPPPPASPPATRTVFAGMQPVTPKILPVP